MDIKKELEELYHQASDTDLRVALDCLDRLRVIELEDKDPPKTPQD